MTMMATMSKRTFATFLLFVMLIAFDSNGQMSSVSAYAKSTTNATSLPYVRSTRSANPFYGLVSIWNTLTNIQRLFINVSTTIGFSSKQILCPTKTENYFLFLLLFGCIHIVCFARLPNCTIFCIQIIIFFFLVLLFRFVSGCSKRPRHKVLCEKQWTFLAMASAIRQQKNQRWEIRYHFYYFAYFFLTLILLLMFNWMENNVNGKGAHTHAPSKCIERRKCVHIFIVDINSFKVVNFHVVFGRSHRTCVCLPAVLLLKRMTNERRMARALIRCNVFIAIFSLAFLFDAQFIFIFMIFFFRLRFSRITDHHWGNTWRWWWFNQFNNYHNHWTISDIASWIRIHSWSQLQRFTETVSHRAEWSIKCNEKRIILFFFLLVFRSHFLVSVCL